MNDLKSNGFLRSEAAILITVIILVSLTLLASYFSAKSATRDRQRVIDVGLIQKALQTYFTENGFYPYGSSTLLPEGVASYVDRWPVAPAADGGCGDFENQYMYSQRSAGLDYSLGFCLGQGSGGISAGSHILTAKGIK